MGVIIKDRPIAFFCLVLVPARTLIDNSFFSFTKAPLQLRRRTGTSLPNISNRRHWTAVAALPSPISYLGVRDRSGDERPIGEFVTLSHCDLQVSYCAAFSYFFSMKNDVSCTDNGLPWHGCCRYQPPFPTYRQCSCILEQTQDNSGNQEESRYRTAGTKGRPEVRGRNQTKRLN